MVRLEDLGEFAKGIEPTGTVLRPCDWLWFNSLRSGLYRSGLIVTTLLKELHPKSRGLLRLQVQLPTYRELYDSYPTTYGREGMQVL